MQTRSTVEIESLNEAFVEYAGGGADSIPVAWLLQMYKAIEKDLKALATPLQVGKRYVMRDGTVTRPLKKDPEGFSHPWYDGTYTWSKSGRYLDEESLSSCDIITIYEE